MEKNKGLWQLLNKQIFIPPAIIITLVVTFGALFPTIFDNGSTILLNIITQYLGWLFVLGSLILLGFCLWAGFSKYGRIKLGGPNAEPEMSKFKWFAVSFTASMAIGITYWCVAEPMTYFQKPPAFLNLEPASIESATVALRYAYLHWTFIPFAIYSSVGISIAFLFYNARKPFRVSTALHPLIGERRCNGMLGSLVDALAIFAIVCGIGTSLGFGTMQIVGGLEYVFGVKSSTFLMTTIIVSMAILYTTAACTGIHKGIKHLGTINMYLYIALLVFVFTLGPSVSMIENTITATGDFLANFIPLVTDLDPIQQTGWHEHWTIFYWAWWLSFAPLTGLFMIKLAKGRTVKQFLIVNLIVPCIFMFLWFGVFGTAAMFSDMFNGSTIGQQVVEQGTQISVFALLEQYPFFLLTALVLLLLVALSFNTQAEASAITLAIMTTVGYDRAGNEQEPPKVVVIFWGSLIAALTIILLYTGGENAYNALQTAVIVAGLPIMILQLFMAYGYYKAMRRCKKYDIVGTFDDPDYKYIAVDNEKTNDDKF